MLLAGLAAAVVFSWRVHASLSIPFSASSSGPGALPIIPAGSKAPGDAGEFNFSNINDAMGGDIYTVTIQVDGQDFVVQLDSGSSDLWIDTSGVDTSKYTSTGLQTGIVYGDGTTAQGPIMLTNVTFGGFSVNQALISAPGSNATAGGDKGLLGVGPPLLSQVSDALQGTQFNGKTILENIFDANPDEPNVITFQLSRSQTMGTTDGGVFTIGEVDQTFQAVTQMPKLPVVSRDRWIVLMDGITVNGQSFNGHSSFNVDGQQEGQTLVNLDTGTSLATVPADYADVIYGAVPGAQFVRSQGIYVLPCDAQVELSFIFGGVAYPVHPIDTVAATLDDNGGVICFGGFIVADVGDSEDMLLGDSFLRNVYSYFDFGAFIAGSQAPFIQLLNTSDPSQFASQFQEMSQQRNQSLTGAHNSSGGGGGDANAAAHRRTGGVVTAAISLMAAVLGAVLL